MMYSKNSGELEERRAWNKAHTKEALRIITEWLVQCRTREFVHLYSYQRDALGWTLEEMGFDTSTIVWDIFCQEIRPMLEYVGGEEESSKTDRSSIHVRWTVAGKTFERYFEGDDRYNFSSYMEIQFFQAFLNNFRFLKNKDKKMWKAQNKLYKLRIWLKDAHKAGRMPCFSVINIGCNLALLKLPEYKIVEWADYSLEGLAALRLEARCHANS